MEKHKKKVISVSAYITNKKDEVLILKRAMESTTPGIWEIPGGGVEWGEDPVLALRREVNEECDLDVEIEGPIDIISYLKERDEYIVHAVNIVFKAFMKPDDQEVRISQEHIEYRWVRKNELNNLEISFFLTRLSTKKYDL